MRQRHGTYGVLTAAQAVASPWFNTQRYWEEHILELREQIALIDEPPLWTA